MPSRTRRLAIAGLAVTLPVLVACGRSGTSSSTPTSTTASVTATAAGPDAAPTPNSLPPGASTPPVPAACAETRDWTTAARVAAGSTTDALYLVRIGEHACFDRVVFDVNGPADVGFDVRYVPVVLADGSGTPLPVAGNAALQVVVRAPEQGADTSGHQPGRVLAGTGDYFYTAAALAGWSSLRAVRFAGFFEGQCTFAIGVREMLPFRAFTLLDTHNQIRRVVVDIAHEPL